MIYFFDEVLDNFSSSQSMYNSGCSVPYISLKQLQSLLFLALRDLLQTLSFTLVFTNIQLKDRRKRR